MGITIISNLFLDYYMPKANGEYVKVYLYLLRALQDISAELSISTLADALDHTENDILRALKYWEKQKLLKLDFDSEQMLTAISLLEIPIPEEEKTTTLQTSLAEENKFEAATMEISKGEKSLEMQKKSYTRNELMQFAAQNEYRQLFFVCEQYLKKTLAPTEIETILYFYEQLHFSADLIEYLVEYCVGRGKASIHYIESVALSWAKAGITSVAQAKEKCNTYNKNYFSIMKAFGIYDRQPVEAELSFIDKWIQEYHFSLELILEACKRTMERLHKPSFEYTNKILKDWNENKVTTLNDIQKLDLEHHKKSNTNTNAAPKQKNFPVLSTRFSNFEQRDYDFDELEKQLLKI